MATGVILPTTHVFDETGVLPENFIENEQRDLPNRDIRAVATRFGSFFADTMVMRDANGVVVPREKLQFALWNEELSAKTGKDCCGAVVILDKNIPAPVYVDYHCVGGPWGASNEHIIELFQQLQADNRPVAWPNIIGKPEGYKPAHHYQDIGDLYGAEYWVAALDRLAQAFLMGDSASHDEIFRYIDGLFTELKQEIVDLGANLKTYIDQQDAIRDDKITTVDNRVTAVRTEMLAKIQTEHDAQAIINTTLQNNITTVNNALTTHAARRDNPHVVTANQAGTYSQAQIDALIAGLNNSLNNFVKKNTAEELSLTSNSGILYAWVSGGWRPIWPPHWQ